MERSINILFFLRKEKRFTGKVLPIYMRITIAGNRFVWSTQKSTEAGIWSNKVGKVKGASEEAKSINAFLELIKHKVFVYHKELILEHKEINVATFKEKWFGISNNRMILKVFQDHNKRVEKLGGMDFANGTLKRYKTSNKRSFR